VPRRGTPCSARRTGARRRWTGLPAGASDRNRNRTAGSGSVR
jgi:hypothetical protein